MFKNLFPVVANTDNSDRSLMNMMMKLYMRK